MEIIVKLSYIYNRLKKFQTMIDKQKRRIKIGHSLQQLEDNIILTLQDKPLIHGNQINEDQDILQNFQKREFAEAAHNSQIKKKIKRIANAATSHLQAKNQGYSGILPHYDDYRYKNQEVQVEQDTVIKPRKPKRNKNVPSDYLETSYTNQVANQYSKTNTMFDKKFRQKAKTNVDDLLSFLNQTAQDNQKNLQQNIDVAAVINSSIKELRENKMTQKKLEKQVIQKQNQFMDQDTDLLMRAMNKSRKIQENQKNGDNKLKQLLQIIKEKQPQDRAKYTQIELNPVTFKLSDQKIEKKDYSLVDASKGKGTSSMMFCSLPSERLSRKVKKEEQLPQSFQEIPKEELEKMKKELEFMQDQTVNTGLAGTLGFLRQRNLLGKQEQVGRNTDKIMQIKQSEDRVKLQYRNASGKLMKPKQAFRYICSAFHGEGPGKNKIEKRRKREMLEQKIKLKANSEGGLMQMLKKHQQKSNQAYMQLHIGKDAKKN